MSTELDFHTVTNGMTPQNIGEVLKNAIISFQVNEVVVVTKEEYESAGYLPGVMYFIKD